MARNRESSEIANIVRSYSNQVATRPTGNILAQSLTEHEASMQAQDDEASDWRKWLEFTDLHKGNDEIFELQQVAKEAAELWRKLKLDIGDLQPYDGSPPTIKNLSTAVSEAQKRWENKRKSGFGKAKQRFWSFLDTMDAHKDLFSLIPDGDKYICLITGVVSTIVKASTNHEIIADGFSDALDDMTRDLHLVKRISQRCDTPSIRLLVALLYREVFRLLCSAMKWYQSWAHRWYKSFNNKFHDKTVKSHVTQIQRHIQRIRDEVNLLTGDTLQSLSKRQDESFNETNYHIDDAAGRVHDGISARMDALDQKFDVIARLIIGKEMSNTLRANAEEVLATQNTAEVLLLEPGDPEIESTAKLAMLHTKQQLETLLSHLERYSGKSKRYFTTSGSTEGRPLIPSEVAVNLQRWLGSRGSDFLWIESPAYVSDDSELTKLALRVSRLASQSNIPCIDICVERTRSSDTQEHSQKEESLIVLVYSFLKRLIMSTPTQLDLTYSLSRDQFLELDGSFDSILKVLKLIRVLLEMMAPGLIVVLYAFDLVDGRDTRDVLVELIHILQDQPPEKRVKVLVISRGKCISLLQTTRPDERSDATRMVLARGSSPLPGGINARDIELPRSRY